MRISKLSLKLKDVKRRLKSHNKGRSTCSAIFPYTIPDIRVPLPSVSKDAASTLQEKRTRGSCRKKPPKKSGFLRVSRHVSQALGGGPITPNPNRAETASVKREGKKDLSSSFVKRNAYSPTPSLSKSEPCSSPILSNVVSPDLSSDTQAVFDLVSPSSASDALVAVDKSWNSVNFYPEYLLGEPFNIVSAYDILPAMPKFSDSIESISVDVFPLRNFQYPIISF